MTLDPYNAFLYRVEEEGDWRVAAKDVIDVAGMPTTRDCARPARRSSGS